MEQKEGLVSVITPMYNAGGYIGETVDSIKAQTYENWELIVIDDGSVDESPGMIQEYQKTDTRIRYWRQPRNMGVAAARNRGLELAKGRYVAFLDSDDVWKPDKLQRQLAFMEQRKAAFCYTACEVIDQEGRSTGKVRQVPESQSYRQLLKGNVIPCLTVVLDRKYIPNIHMPQIPHEDYGAWLDILKTGVTAYGINEVLASYRVNQESVSGNKLRAARWTWDIYRRQQKLGFWKSLWCFGHYVAAAFEKWR